MLSKHSRSDRKPRSNSVDPVLDESMYLAHDIAEQGEPEHIVPKPIVSIHGRDVRDEELETRHSRRQPRRAA